MVIFTCLSHVVMVLAPSFVFLLEVLLRYITLFLEAVKQIQFILKRQRRLNILTLFSQCLKLKERCLHADFYFVEKLLLPCKVRGALHFFHEAKNGGEISIKGSRLAYSINKLNKGGALVQFGRCTF